MNRPQITKEHYERYGTLYKETLTAPIMQAHTHSNPYVTQALLAGMIGFNKDDYILDAGSGWGGPAIFFAKNFDIKILGINNNKEQVLCANEQVKKQKLDNVSFKEHDFHDLYPLSKDNSFDKILFLQSIGHAKSLHYILKECNKVLSRTGTIIIYTMLRSSNKSKLGDKLMEYTEKCYGYETYKKDNFIDIANQCGYDTKFFDMKINYNPKDVVQFEYECSKDSKNWAKQFELNTKYGWKYFDMKLIKLQKKFKFGKNI